MLFLDARHIFRQIDRAHRDFTPEQHEFLANIVRLYRGEEPEFVDGSEAMLKERFPDLAYVDVPGLCKVATVDEIESHGWSLNPGRYVGVADGEDDGFDFAERFGELSEEFQALDDRGGRTRRSRSCRNAVRLLSVMAEWLDAHAWAICSRVDQWRDSVDGIDATPASRRRTPLVDVRGLDDRRTSIDRRLIRRRDCRLVGEVHRARTTAPGEVQVPRRRHRLALSWTIPATVNSGQPAPSAY